MTGANAYFAALHWSGPGTFEKCRNFYFLVAIGGKADIRSSWQDFAL
jgi:hypothetical protein